MPNQVVRAVDVGRGNTKFIASETAGKLQCTAFPSEAIPAEFARSKNGAADVPRVIEVPVNQLFYSVGPDVAAAADVFNAQTLQHENYYKTPEYLALTLGALYFMEVPVIDLLVVGMPVSTYKNGRAARHIERRLKGQHRVCQDRSVTVREVKTLAQPAGALMYYGVHSGNLAAVGATKNLVVDVGSRTFDWIVTAGMQQIEKRSYSIPRGMFDVLNTIAQGISHTSGTDYRNYTAIDIALRNGTDLELYGKPYSLSRHLPMARTVAEQAVAEMQHYVGDATDLNNIILVGGGAAFFRNAVRRAFPKHNVEVLPDQLNANVLGFQLAGCALMGLPTLAAATATARG